MNNVVIVKAKRTAIGSLGGTLKKMTPLDLSIPVMKELYVDGLEVDDVIWGCNYQRTYKENNLARVAAVKSGLPESIPGVTIHRNCTSSMTSIELAYYQIKSGDSKCLIAGGAESMSTAPHMVFGARDGKKFGNFELRDSMWDSLTHLGVGPAMGITAENVAEKYGVSRENQDEFSARSQSRAVAAIKEGKFKDEIIPLEVKSKKDIVIFDQDEYPKEGVTADKLSKLKPVFKEDGTVTAGNASGMNDGAAGVLLMSEEYAKEKGLPIMAYVRGVAKTGVSPDYMGIGPISAVNKVLEKSGISKDEVGLYELNEAFASQCVACARELGVDSKILNVNGGAIALGHPVGASGSRITITLLYEMKRRNEKYGVASLCAGGGMGTAVIIENAD